MSGIVVTKEDLIKYANSLNIGDIVTVKIGLNAKKVRGRIINKFPHLCQIEWEEYGKKGWDCASWFDVYMLSMEEGRI